MNSGNSDHDELRILVGQQPLFEFVRLVRNRTKNGYLLNEKLLMNEWSIARRYLDNSEATETSLADVTHLAAMPSELAEMADGMLGDDLRRDFGNVPLSWANVDLRSLVVLQRYVNSTFVDALCRSLSLRPKMGALLEMAAGLTNDAAEIEATRVSGNQFVCVSRSSDMRILGTMQLDPASVKTLQTSGRGVVAFGIVVGYSANYIAAVQMNDRLVLTNGTHRVCALLQKGIHRAPIIVVHPQSREDLDTINFPGSAQDIEFLFDSPRPPFLRDYLDERLVKRIAVPRSLNMLQLELSIQQSRIASPAD